MAGYYEPKLIDGWVWDECASALQKSIRRGLEYDSCYFAFIFYKSGFGQYLWRRLAVICSEDIGNGDPQAVLILSALNHNWDSLYKNSKDYSLDKFLPFAQAILYLCRSKKSRENDNLANLIEEEYNSGKRLEIQDYCLDSHCDRGREKFGRFGDLKDGKEELRLKMWFEEWSKLNKVAYPDIYEDKIRKIWTDRALKSKVVK